MATSVSEGANARWVLVGLAGAVATSMLLGAALTLLVVGLPDHRASAGAQMAAETPALAAPGEAPPPAEATAPPADPAAATASVEASPPPPVASAPETGEPSGPSAQPAPAPADDVAALNLAANAPEASPAPVATAPAEPAIAAPETPAPEVPAQPAAPAPPPPPAALPESRVAALAAATAPGGYALQVGAFRDERNASAFLARLAEAGFAPALGTRGPWTIVTVGPYPSAAEATEASGAISRAFGVAPILRSVEALR